jgi:hypothetical protein
MRQVLAQETKEMLAVVAAVEMHPVMPQVAVAVQDLRLPQ